MIARRILQLAALVMPRERRLWTDAMSYELEHIAEPREALDFAAGVLRTALTERIIRMPKLIATGRGLVAASVLLFGMALIAIAAKGVLVIGDGAYPYYEALVSSGELEAAERHRTVFVPLMLGWMAVLGVAFAGAAAALLTRRMKLFGLSLGGGALIVAAVAVPALMTDARGSSLFVMLAATPVALTAISAFLLSWAERRLA